MFRYEFLVLVDGEREVFSVVTEGDWNSAREIVKSEGLEIVKSLCSIDLTPQKALAF